MTLSDYSYNFNEETDKNEFLFLIKTQIKEIEEHTDKYKQAKEFCDIISICVEFLSNNGFNPEEIMDSRKKDVISRKEEILKKYNRLRQEC